MVTVPIHMVELTDHPDTTDVGFAADRVEAFEAWLAKTRRVITVFSTVAGRTSYIVSLTRKSALTPDSPEARGQATEVIRERLRQEGVELKL